MTTQTITTIFLGCDSIEINLVSRNIVCLIFQGGTNELSRGGGGGDKKKTT